MSADFLRLTNGRQVQASTQIYLCLATTLATTSRYQEGLITDTDLHENCLYRHRYDTDPIIGGILLYTGLEPSFSGFKSIAPPTRSTTHHG